MHLKNIILSLCLLLTSKPLFTQSFSKETILISTSLGNMKIKLFNETLQHRDNFLKLVKNHFYDSLLFHRVITDFMIQGGDPESKTANSSEILGEGDLDYTIPAEFEKALCHKKGMLCAARNGDDVNPKKASSACQFYIIQGKVRDDQELKLYEKRINQNLIDSLKGIILSTPENNYLKEKITHFKSKKNNDSLFYYTKQLDEKIHAAYLKSQHYIIPEAHKLIYKTIGGTPHLDNNYSIFGEVIEGLEIIDKIANANTNKNDRPLIDIRMRISIIEE